MIDLIISTMKSKEEVAPLVDEIKKNTGLAFFLICTCSPGSAAENRNRGLDMCQAKDIVIMVDDDTHGYHKGWEENIVEPLYCKDIIVSSARLMGKMLQGRIDYDKPGLVTCQNYDMSIPWVKVDFIPTTCVAFRYSDLRFNEEFKGSGFEDTYFFRQMKERNPGGQFVINNKVKIKHSNEKKNQVEHWGHNTNLWNKLTNKAKWHG